VVRYAGTGLPSLRASVSLSFLLPVLLPRYGGAERLHSLACTGEAWCMARAVCEGRSARDAGWLNSISFC